MRPRGGRWLPPAREGGPLRRSNRLMMETQVMAPPQGFVALMFTDIEGSTAGWEKHGPLFGEALEIHDRLMREALARHGGFEVKTVGDAFMVAFARAADAVRCAAEIQRCFSQA